MIETAIRRMEGQLDRARRLFELGEHDEEAFLLKRSAIREGQGRLRVEMARSEGDNDLRWCQAQLLDLLGAREAADGSQRTRLLAGLFERIEAQADEAQRVHVVAVSRPGWRPFFEGRMPLERETGFEAPSTTYSRVEVRYRLISERNGHQ